jgi:NTP pyrophosphatase (non-canonical NTP hydrolase)
MIDKENQHQLTKWGVQTHSPFEWLTYTTEELGELAEAISEHYYRGAPKELIVKEAIQVATLALKIAEMHLD